jgi:hypothetical protein
MLRSTDRKIVVDVSEDIVVFVFKAKEFQDLRLL